MDNASKSGSDGGNPEGLESRFVFLEKQFERIDGKLDAIFADIGTLRIEQAYLKGKIDQLPTTLQLLIFIIAVLSIAGLARYFTP